MLTTTQLLDRAKKAQGIESDYRLAQVLGVAKTAVTNYRVGRSHPADDVAARLADLAGLDVSSVLAGLYAERAKTPEVRALWIRMATQLRHAVAAVMLALGAAMLLVAPNPGGAQAATPSPTENALGGLGIMSNRARRLRRQVARAGMRTFARILGWFTPRPAPIAYELATAVACTRVALRDNPGRHAPRPAYFLAEF